jgi:predicted transcriptional regulator
MNVLLSIKPKYAASIISGNKLYEFRRTIFKNSNIERVYLYATAPRHQVVGSFKIGRVLENHPDKLWTEVKEGAGLSFEEFSQYFANCEKGYAIEIRELRIFNTPIDPRLLILGFRAPRSFRYVDGQFSGLDF